MQEYLNRGLQILILMSAGLMTAAADGANPPTREERDDVQKRLDKARGAFRAQDDDVTKTKALMDNLDKSIEALEKTLEPLAKVTDNDELREEADKMRTTLTKL